MSHPHPQRYDTAATALTSQPPPAATSGNTPATATPERRPSVNAATPGPAQPSCVVRVQDGRVYDGPLDHQHQRRLHLRMLHEHNGGYVELAAGHRPAGGKVQITTRRREDHYLPGGQAGHDTWLEDLDDLAASHDRRDDEVFVGVAMRTKRSGDKDAVHGSWWLWVDIDNPDRLDALDAFCNRPVATWTGSPEDPNAWLRTPHLVVESAGSGGRHAYWRLATPLPALEVNSHTGEVIEPIERANGRLVWALGVDEHGKPDVADVACRDRSRVLRLAGTRNFKTGAYARIIWADLWRGGYDLDELVGDLPDASHRAGVRKIKDRPRHDSDRDNHRDIPAVVYFERLAGIRVPERGLVQCPSPAHQDRSPSCSVGDTWWNCFGCGAGGTAVDLASILDGGPIGDDLRGEDFKRALQRVKDTCL